LVSCRHDGCCDGMRSINKRHWGKRLLKPWTIYSTSSTMAHALHCECDHTHEHAIVEGCDTKHSENYTAMFATRFH
jgi:hypothetical protein